MGVVAPEPVQDHLRCTIRRSVNVNKHNTDLERGSVMEC